MDTSRTFNLMLNQAIKQHPEGFKNFGRTINIQDRLQEIYGRYVAVEMGVVYREYFIKDAFLDFVDWMGKQYHDEPHTCVPTNNFCSGEQLWFAFVMQEVYGEKWNNEDWVKE